MRILQFHAPKCESIYFFLSILFSRYSQPVVHGWESSCLVDQLTGSARIEGKGMGMMNNRPVVESPSRGRRGKKALKVRIPDGIRERQFERGWLQEPVRRSFRRSAATDVFCKRSIGPLRHRQVFLRWNHRRYFKIKTQIHTLSITRFN